MKRILLALGVALAAAGAGAQPKPEALLRKEAGNDFLKRREYEKARDEYLAALKADPGYEDAHYNLGVVYFFRLQDYPRALYHLATYARLAKDAPDLSQVKSLVFQSLEKIEEAEREAYQKALTAGTSAALREFSEQHAESVYAADAKEKTRLLEAHEEELRKRTQDAEAAYNEALAKGTVDALDTFLGAYPDVAQATEARRLRAGWTAEEKELQAATAAGTIEALEKFVVARPGSHYVPQAQARIERLKAAEAAFAAAAASRSPQALEEFLAKFSETPREAEARALLGALRKAEADANAKAEADLKAKAESEQKAAAEARAKADAEARAKADAEAAARAAGDRAWGETQQANSAGAYESFSKAYPSHPGAPEAARRAAALRAGAPPAWGAPTPPPAPIAAPQLPAPPQPQPQAPAAPPAPLSAEEQLAKDWSAARTVDTREAYEAFLRAHPHGEEAEAARKRLEELTSGGETGEKRKALDRYRRMIQGK